jgi:hypothetical protein
MTYKLIAVPEDRLSVGEAGAHIIGPPGPFEVVTNQNVSALLAIAANDVTDVIVTRSALAVVLHYVHHDIASRNPDPQLREALRVLNEEFNQ